MTKKTILHIILGAAIPLFVPFIGMQVSSEWNWGPGDFVFAWLLFAGAGFAYKFVTAKAGNKAYRIGAGLAIGTALVITWVNLAVGIIGSEDNPANLLYLGVIAVGIIGASIARFRPPGMARTLFAMALTVALVPVIAFLIWRPGFSPGVVQVFGLNAGFVFLFAGAGLLFRSAANMAPDSFG
jgi:hypothetical protein